MRIRSITDVVTNSSNETFITRYKPSDKIPYNSCSCIESFDDILRGGTYDGFDKDLMVYILVRHYGETLTNNPLPVPSCRKGEKDPWRIMDWAFVESNNKEAADKIWEDFVNENKEKFEKLIGLYYIWGPYDHDYNDEVWEDFNEELGYDAVMRARSGYFI